MLVLKNIHSRNLKTKKKTSELESGNSVYVHISYKTYLFCGQMQQMPVSRDIFFQTFLPDLGFLPYLFF